jgi:hypothetical protein
MEQEAAHRRSEGGTESCMQLQNSKHQQYPKLKVQIQKSFLEGKGIVFYEINIQAEDEKRFSLLRDCESSGMFPMRETITIHRRYKHFKFFHKRLTLLLFKEEKEEKGWRKQLPKLPPLRPKLLVDHSSPVFVSDRSRALEVYLERILQAPLIGFVLKTTDLVRWLTDDPEPFYPPSSQGNCPYLYRCWQVFSTSAIAPWADHESKENANEDRNHTMHTLQEHHSKKEPAEIFSR